MKANEHILEAVFRSLSLGEQFWGSWPTCAASKIKNSKKFKISFLTACVTNYDDSWAAGLRQTRNTVLGFKTELQEARCGSTQL